MIFVNDTLNSNRTGRKKNLSLEFWDFESLKRWVSWVQWCVPVHLPTLGQTQENHLSPEVPGQPVQPNEPPFLKNKMD
jgi:hypothetical protein